MPVALQKDSIDLGIVAVNGSEMVAFYRDLLGFNEEPQTPFPMGGVMHRLRCGSSLIKLVVPDATPSERPAPGPITNASGLRYWTMIVTNLSEMMAACEQAGHPIAVPVTEVRPGVTIGMVEDPDGNWVEFVEMLEN